MRVRYAEAYRADAQALGSVLVAGPGGVQVPLGQVARISAARGPAMISSENGLLLATVLLNVQDRDVGGFVEEARTAVARAVTLPAGYFVEWSGRWENQARARQRLQLVLPIVLVVIFVLLYFTYGSLVEAAHVLLAVPFALTGGIYLLWALGYNFSVAVWVGFIALFGTAVQTGVVMVIYLEEAVARKRAELGGPLTRADLRDAVVEGALLRLRPKVMTVSTVVAGLLPIMWSTSVGAEVMKPLAAPVLGGMVSSLIHVLVVTPVIFFWIHERRLGLAPEAITHVSEAPSWSRRRAAAAAVAGVAVVAAFITWRMAVPGQDAPAALRAKVIQTVHAKDLDVVLLSDTGALRQGHNRFFVEFRRTGSPAPLDVGTVRASANMPMPGMVMSSGLRLQPTAVPGRYTATAEFGMAGMWQMSIEWDGPAGRGTASFQGGVQ